MMNRVQNVRVAYAAQREAWFAGQDVPLTPAIFADIEWLCNALEESCGLVRDAEAALSDLGAELSEQADYREYFGAGHRGHGLKLIQKLKAFLAKTE